MSINCSATLHGSWSKSLVCKALTNSGRVESQGTCGVDLAPGAASPSNLSRSKRARSPLSNRLSNLFVKYPLLYYVSYPMFFQTLLTHLLCLFLNELIEQ